MRRTLALLLLSVALAHAQQPPTFRAGVDAVAIDAFVTDAAGNPVRNLTVDEFELLENGRPQRIASFSEVNIPIRRPEPYLPTAAEPDVATNGAGEGRLYVIALDEVHPALALKARRFLRDFIEQHFESNDIGIVVSIGRARAGDMQDFTGSRRLLLNAIDRFTGGFPIATNEDLTAPTTFATPHSSNVNSQARALRDLMESLANISGRRKAVIYVTSEVGQSALDLSGSGRANVWDVIDYRGGVRSLAFDDLRAAMTAAMRGGVAFYTIDPAGLCALDCPEGADNLERIASLRKLSEATGGFAVVSSNQIAEAFPRLVAENSNYYVLGFSSDSDTRDGRYRQLTVRVKRPGLTVRARDGYIASSKNTPEPKARTGVTLSAGVAESIGSPVADAAVPMAVFAAAYRATGKEANVVISITMAAQGLGLVEQAGAMTGQVEVAAVAVSAAGKVTRGQRERFTLRLKPDTWTAAMNTGVRVITGMSLPPGRYQLRVAGGNTNATRAGAVMHDLDVPDFSKPPLAVSALALTSRRSTGLTIPSTTVKPVVPEAPVTVRDFAAGDTLSVYAEIYDNRARDRHRLMLLAELRTPAGTRVGAPVTDTRTNGQPTLKFEPSLPLDISPGAYVLHVEVASTDAKQPAVTRDVPLRVN